MGHCEDFSTYVWSMLFRYVPGLMKQKMPLRIFMPEEDIPSGEAVAWQVHDIKPLRFDAKDIIVNIFDHMAAAHHHLDKTAVHVKFGQGMCNGRERDGENSYPSGMVWDRIFHLFSTSFQITISLRHAPHYTMDLHCHMLHIFLPVQLYPFKSHP